MSDFDKEAEREKLREKYEQEQREREATEKMSELLLQGATMTNAHCSDCGDPIFRYDGQEFCATCEKAVDRDTGEERPEDEPTDDDAENIEVTSPDQGARVAFGGENVDETPETTAEQPQSPPSPADRTGDGAPTAEADADSSTAPERPPSSPRQSPPPRKQAAAAAAPSADPSETGDVSAASESLVRTLTYFSRQAEATDDPRRAQEYLAAAREAAQALSALGR